MSAYRHLVLAAVAVCLGLSAGSQALGQTQIASIGPIETVDVTAMRLQGPGVSPNGESEFSTNAQNIANLPSGADTVMTDVLAQMPGVAVDQNQQIHIRDTEGPEFQYQINGVLVPLDINTNPPFISMINPRFISQLNLLTGVLPAQYSYATGGIVDIATKTGCGDPGGSVTLLGGMHGTIEPSAAYGGCDGRLGYYVDGEFEHSNTAFSSATPGPDAIHDRTDQGEVFGYFNYDLDAHTQLGLVVSGAASDNQLPNVAGLAPQFALTGSNGEPSADINSDLDFRDALAVASLSGSEGSGFKYQIAYAFHAISEQFRPDDVGELIYQGVASRASHDDIDNTLEGDLEWTAGRNDVSAGFYLGSYRVAADDTSLAFPVDPVTHIPVTVTSNTHADNIVTGIYANDLVEIADTVRLNVGLRFDDLTGFTQGSQLDPTINLSWSPSGETTLHAGVARTMQVPSFQGISPTVSTTFANTTAEGPPGIATPTVEDDYVWDAGIATKLTDRLTLSEDNYYEINHHYLDTGQFGAVPIFAPFNYEHGYMWGNELALNYRGDRLSAYANVTVGRNMQEGVATGQFNFDPDELAYIDTHHIVLDHQPLAGASVGATYDMEPWSFSIDGTWSSGLRAGFADEERLPNTLQINVSVQRTFDIPGVGEITDRIVVLNALDRINLIRPAEGIGIFQSAYGPRFTVYDALTIPF